MAIGRRLGRNGESDYKINGNSVRMRDVHKLFWDSGLGRDAFAIFEQGRIEEIIHKNPEERRPILEQAAGIHKYRQQWREAAKKLKQTEANLARVGDVLKEVEKQMKTLEKQVDEAKAFKDHKARLDELEQGILTARLEQAEGEKERCLKEIEALKEQLANDEDVAKVVEAAKGDVALVEETIAKAYERTSIL